MSTRTVPTADAGPLSRIAREDPPATLLAIAWCAEDDGRTGEIAVVGDHERPQVLGREDDPSDADRVRFFRQRPGTLTPAAPLGAPGISRRQLLVTWADEGSVHVQNVGQCPLMVNGIACEESDIAPGDVLYLRRQLLLYCFRRPAAMPPLRHYDRAWMGAFGQPDKTGMVGESAVAWGARDALAFLSKTDVHALVLGASGTGKELAARSVHALSRRGASGPFVARNAATLPAGLIDAELFGNVKNYPNPGMPERAGLVGEADGGTLFLDEIGELPVELQAHLLRVLDAGGEYQRLGEARTRRSTFRLVGATNREESALKHDLAARLTARVRMPSLDERREDIPLLLTHLMARAAAKSPETAGRFMQAPGRARIEPALVEHALRTHWPTNTRDLEALLWKAMAESDEDAVALPMSLRGRPSVPSRSERGEAKSEPKPPVVEPDEGAIRAELAKQDGNVARAAVALGVSRFALYRLMKKHGMATSGG